MLQYKVENFEVTSFGQIQEVKDWCHNNFRQWNWECHNENNQTLWGSRVFAFRYEEDRTLFLLKWINHG
jgi:hypothetical protein